MALLEEPISASIESQLIQELFRIGADVDINFFQHLFYDRPKVVVISLPRYNWLYESNTVPYTNAESLVEYLGTKWASLGAYDYETTELTYTLRDQLWTRKDGHQKLDESSFEISCITLRTTVEGQKLINSILRQKQLGAIRKGEEIPKEELIDPADCERPKLCYPKQVIDNWDYRYDPAVFFMDPARQYEGDPEQAIEHVQQVMDEAEERAHRSKIREYQIRKDAKEKGVHFSIVRYYIDKEYAKEMNKLVEGPIQRVEANI